MTSRQTLTVIAAVAVFVCPSLVRSQQVEDRGRASARMFQAEIEVRQRRSELDLAKFALEEANKVFDLLQRELVLKPQRPMALKEWEFKAVLFDKDRGSHTNSVQGTTDDQGQFTAYWMKMSGRGSYMLGIYATERTSSQAVRSYPSKSNDDDAQEQLA